MRRLILATERLEGIDSVFLRLGVLVCWPIHLLCKLLALFAGLLPGSLKSVLVSPFRLIHYLHRRAIVGFVWLAERMNLDGLVLGLVRLTKPLWYPFAAFLGFLSAWHATRDYRQLLWSSPVLIVLVPLIAVVGWRSIVGNESVAQKYRVAVKQARDENDYERVQLLERKLAQLGVSTERTDFQSALALAQRGQLDAAYQRMQRLAPLEEAGYASAHYWIVQRLMSGELDVEVNEAHRLAKIHLDHLQSLGVKGVDFDLMRAFALRRDQPRDAVKVLQQHAGRYLPADALRMEINLSLEQLDDARRDARFVRMHLEDRSRKGEELSTRDYAAWAIAESLLENLPKAHQLAERWHSADPEDATSRQLLLQLAQRLFEAEIARVAPAPKQLEKLLLQVAGLAEDSALHDAIHALLRREQDSAAIRQTVQNIADSPQTPAPVLQILGSLTGAMGQHERAKTYLLRATAKNPKDPVAWNNYAWLECQDDHGDFEKALMAVNKAIAISPNEFRFRETRGQVLIRLGKWRQAIDDLEFAANGMPASSAIHHSLAKAYEAMGDSRLASIHREQAQHLTGGR